MSETIKQTGYHEKAYNQKRSRIFVPAPFCKYYYAR